MDNIASRETMSTLLSHFYIIDDDPSFGKSLKRLLNTKGFVADHFGSAQSFFLIPFLPANTDMPSLIFTCQNAMGFV